MACIGKLQIIISYVNISISCRPNNKYTRVPSLRRMSSEFFEGHTKKRPEASSGIQLQTRAIQQLVRKTTQEPPLTLGAVYLHQDSSY